MITVPKKNQPRFRAGKLVMLSKKNTKSGELPYFSDEEPSAAENPLAAGYLGRGIPVLLIEDPVLIDQKAKPKKSWVLVYSFKRNRKQKQTHTCWKIRFLLGHKIYRLHLTKNQYDHELVLAVPRRMQKDYSASQKNDVTKQKSH
jgi:hypothetical protein